MNKFTPGSWHVTRGLYGQKDGCTIWGPKNDEGAFAYVCDVDGVFNRAADADLIAAAPDLARALEAAKVALGAAIMIADAQAADAARRATRDANNMHTVNVHLEAKGRWEKLAAEWTIARDDAAAVLVNAVGEG